MDNSTELISVIIPVYNRENTLERAVESVLRQSISNWELILVDDGSKDRSGKMCDEYAKRNNRVSVVHTENFGETHARNVGLDNARGEWIAFLDSDDEFMDDALYLMYSNSADTDLVIAMADVTKCTLKADRPMRIELQSEESDKLLFAYLYSNVCSKLIRKSRINTRFDETIAKNGDCPFSMSFLAQLDHIVFVPSVVCRYFDDTSNRITRNFHSSQLYSHKIIFQKTVQTFHRDSAIKWAGNRFVLRAINYFYALIQHILLDSASVHYLIQSQLEENILPVKDDVNTDGITDFQKTLWDALCSIDADIVIKIFTENYENFVSLVSCQKFK